MIHIQPLLDIKNYDAICSKICNHFTSEPDLNQITFGAIGELYPNCQDGSHLDSYEAVRFIIKQFRTYCKHFQLVDIADYPELVDKLIKHLTYGITD